MKTDIVVSSNIVEKADNRLPFKEEATIALFALVEALSREVMSSDVWWLANHSARKSAVDKYGISVEAYDEVMVRLEKARKEVRKSNPMHSMF